VRDAGKWHAARARGQRERFERVDGCQRETAVRIQCESCGVLCEHVGRCRCALACTSCRGKISYEKRAKLSVARRSAVHQAFQAGLFRWNRKGGRWSEKLLTLTIPHLPELGVIARIELIRSAGSLFSRFFGQWLKSTPLWRPGLPSNAQTDGHDGPPTDEPIPLSGKPPRTEESAVRRDLAHARRYGAREPGRHVGASGYWAYADYQGRSLVRWVRHVEWTPGSDLQGHPHYHFWFLGPYLPHAILEAIWTRAVLAAARLRPELADWSDAQLADRIGRAFVSVEAVRHGPGSLAEVIKYLFKDVDARGDRLDPQLWAKVFEAFDGTRSTQGSAGFLGLAARTAHGMGDGVPCGDCGVRKAWKVERRPLTLQEREAVDRAKREKPGLTRVRPATAQPGLRGVYVA
jgi:hypothetical protein